jgi:hypothetical protein
MSYIIWIGVVLAFSWYWNKGFSPLHVPAPNVQKIPRTMVNGFLALVLIFSVLQAFGIGRGTGFPLPK